MQTRRHTGENRRAFLFSGGRLTRRRPAPAGSHPQAQPRARPAAAECETGSGRLLTTRERGVDLLGTAERVVDARQQILAADHRGRWIEMQLAASSAPTCLPSAATDDATERRVHVVVVPADDLRLDERVGRQCPLFGILEERSRGEEVGGKVAGEPRAWMTPVSE